MFDVINFVPASDIANNGTVTVNYPTGRSKGNYSLAPADHLLSVNGDVYTAPLQFTLTFNANASNITLTNKTGITIKAGATCAVQVARAGQNDGRPFNPPIGPNYPLTGLMEAAAWSWVVNLGSPTALSTTAILNAVAVAGTGENLTSTYTNDVPRALQYVSSNGGDTTQTITTKGTDIFGQAMTEQVTMNGTTAVKGKKAFNTVTSIKSSAALTGNLSVGTTDILGLPVFLASEGQIEEEYQDGVRLNREIAKIRLPFFINQTDLLAPTAQNLIAPIAGTITAAKSIVQVAVTTGGTLTTKINNSATTGGVITVANSATVRTVNSATAFTAANTVAVGDAISIVPASFASAGALNGYVEITPTSTNLAGTVVAGDTSTQTATTGDVRGTYTPPVATDGSKGFVLLISLPNPKNIGVAQYST
jgi:hypothetical protein